MAETKTPRANLAGRIACAAVAAALSLTVPIVATVAATPASADPLDFNLGPSAWAISDAAIYDGPAGKRIGTLKNGQQVLIGEDCQYGTAWCKIANANLDLPDGVGWVAGSALIRKGDIALPKTTPVDKFFDKLNPFHF